MSDPATSSDRSLRGRPVRIGIHVTSEQVSERKADPGKRIRPEVSYAFARGTKFKDAEFMQ